MRIRRGSTAEQSLDHLEESKVERLADLARQEQELEAARRAVREARQVEAAALLDEDDPTAAKESRVDAEARLAELTSELDGKRRAISLLDTRLEAKREEIRAEQLAEGIAALQRGLAAPVKATERIAAAVAELTSASEALVAGREYVNALRDRVTELGGDRYEHEADEAEWKVTPELLEFLSKEKPRRPLAEQERHEQQRQREAENAPRRERAHWLEQARALAALSWSPEETERKCEEFFTDVPDRLRDDVREVYASERAKVLANRRSSFARV